VPADFKLNPKVQRQLKDRLTAIDGNGAVDWGFAELLAFGTLLCEGTPVRLSGQDCERGTFSQRHAVWQDMQTQQPYLPLNQLRPEQAHFCVYNSSLSEGAVLGFDYGYSLAEPRMLILWEAQFGDFANGAQVIIDQFIGPALAKWQRASGLVMLLPHGYEGQGPEHSNAYLERYLQACAEDNLQVCSLTTPAQYFHALRRQLRRPFRRPLIVMSPKSLLLHKQATSPLDQLIDGRFNEVLDDPQPPTAARRIVFCCGKLFYDLLEQRQQQPAPDVAIVRIEQLYPLHDALLREIAARYPAGAELVWAQEEPQNRGAWSFISRQLERLFPGRPLRYIGRKPSASPATGSMRIHQTEQKAIVQQAILE
jgi:2-oxoglutarate dehydrogenase E1 component